MDVAYDPNPAITLTFKGNPTILRAFVVPENLLRENIQNATDEEKKRMAAEIRGLFGEARVAHIPPAYIVRYTPPVFKPTKPGECVVGSEGVLVLQMNHNLGTYIRAQNQHDIRKWIRKRAEALGVKVMVEPLPLGQSGQNMYFAVMFTLPAGASNSLNIRGIEDETFDTKKWQIVSATCDETGDRMKWIVASTMSFLRYKGAGLVDGSLLVSDPLKKTPLLLDQKVLDRLRGSMKEIKPDYVVPNATCQRTCSPEMVQVFKESNAGKCCVTIEKLTALLATEDQKEKREEYVKAIEENVSEALVRLSEQTEFLTLAVQDVHNVASILVANGVANAALVQQLQAFTLDAEELHSIYQLCIPKDLASAFLRSSVRCQDSVIRFYNKSLPTFSQLADNYEQIMKAVATELPPPEKTPEQKGFFKSAIECCRRTLSAIRSYLAEKSATIRIIVVIIGAAAGLLYLFTGFTVFQAASAVFSVLQAVYQFICFGGISPWVIAIILKILTLAIIRLLPLESLYRWILSGIRLIKTTFLGEATTAADEAEARKIAEKDTADITSEAKVSEFLKEPYSAEILSSKDRKDAGTFSRYVKGLLNFSTNTGFTVFVVILEVLMSFIGRWLCPAIPQKEDCDCSEAPPPIKVGAAAGLPTSTAVAIRPSGEAVGLVPYQAAIEPPAPVLGLPYPPLPTTPVPMLGLPSGLETIAEIPPPLVHTANSLTDAFSPMSISQTTSTFADLSALPMDFRRYPLGAEGARSALVSVPSFALPIEEVAPGVLSEIIPPVEGAVAVAEAGWTWNQIAAHGVVIAHILYQPAVAIVKTAVPYVVEAVSGGTVPAAATKPVVEFFPYY